jgi:putative acetyltransferase
MNIRPFRHGDESALHAVFHSAIHGIASRDYSRAQVEAWAPTEVTDDLSHLWTKKIRSIRPFVVEMDSAMAAYGDIQASGYIDHFFVSASFARRGVGTFLMQFLLKKAVAENISELSSDVSVTAQPFFERFGFRVIEHRVAVVRGVALANALMRRTSVEPTRPHSS